MTVYADEVFQTRIIGFQVRILYWPVLSTSIEGVTDKVIG
jgi:hypothetical protein